MRVEAMAGMKDQDRLLTLTRRLSAPHEVHELLDILDSVIDRGVDYRALDVLDTVRQAKRSRPFDALALHINNLARRLTFADSAVARAPLIRALAGLRERLRTQTNEFPSPAAGGLAETAVARMALQEAISKVYQLVVWRTPGEIEIDTWMQNLRNGLPFHEFLLLMCGSPEAKVDAHGAALLQEVDDGNFVLLAHEHTQSRGAGAAEMNHWLHMLERGEVSRIDTLCRLFRSGVHWAEQRAEAPPHDGLSCRIMGTQRDLTAADWARQARDRKEEGNGRVCRDQQRHRHRFHVRGEPRVLVSALTSLYRGSDFIEQFMDNITSQNGFDDYCELVIVDADSPEDEADTIRRYLARHRNINYIRMNYRIGIYEAWNVAAQAARGEYLTNANLDDLRRHDSFLLQAGTLDNLPFVDVVYQDLYYTFDPRLSFEEIAAFGHQTDLPVVTLHNLQEYNSPHNAPMWRKRLHEEVGYFDTNFRSAGDYEFWFRCLAAGKTFYKINDPHVVYYQNPKGISTRPDSRGVVEALEVHKRYCRKLMPAEATMPTEDFLRHVDDGRADFLRRSGKYRYRIAHDALRNVTRDWKFRQVEAR